VLTANWNISLNVSKMKNNIERTHQKPDTLPLTTAKDSPTDFSVTLLFMSLVLPESLFEYMILDSA
jgi:hypothetical protein